MTEFLQSQGWCTAEVLSKQRAPAHKGARWLFKATPPSTSYNEQESWTYESDDDEMCIFITKAPARVPKVQDTWTVPAPKPSWKKQSEMKIDAQGGNAKPKENTREVYNSEQVHPTLLDADDDEDVKEEAHTRKPRARSQPQRERSRSPAQRANENPDDTENRSESSARSKSSKRYPTGHNGPTSIVPYLCFDFCKQSVLDGPEPTKVDNCGYRVLCCGLEGKETSDSDIARKAGILRCEAIGHIRKHYARYANFYAPRNSSEPATLQEWLDQAKDPTFWIEGMQLQAVCEKKGVPLVIWHQLDDTCGAEVSSLLDGMGRTTPKLLKEEVRSS